LTAAPTIVSKGKRNPGFDSGQGPSHGGCRGQRKGIVRIDRAQIGCGVVDLSFQTLGSEDPDALMEALELFSKKMLPHIRDI
jgi:hypothetical protein